LASLDPELHSIIHGANCWLEPSKTRHASQTRFERTQTRLESRPNHD
jgi:hypothetical protein